MAKKQVVIYKRNKGAVIKNICRNPNLYLMIMPATILFILFSYFPLYGIIIAFKNYDMVEGIMASKWIGFKHFVSFFNDPYCFRIIKNTLLLGFLDLIWSFWPPILLAILMNEIYSIKLKKVIQTISYLPHFVAIVVIIGMMMELLGPTGVFNNMRQSMGLGTVHFFNEAKFFRPMYIISGIWQNVGWGTIIYMAALAGVDQELFEAAYIDGANRFQRIVHISIPSITPTITVLLVLSAASIVNVSFEKIFLMYSPAVYDTADVISTYVYRRGINNMNFSYGAAIGLLNSIVAFIILIVTNKTVDKMNGTALW